MERKEQILKYLSDERNSYFQYIQRREIAAWSAIILYVAFALSLYSTFSNNTSLSNNKDELLLSTILVIIFGYILFRFIHSQYSTIYWRRTYNLSIKRIIFDLIEGNKTVADLDFSYDDNYKKQPKFIAKNMDNEFKFTQPFKGKIHPLAILLRFWFKPLHYWIYVKKYELEPIERLDN